MASYSSLGIGAGVDLQSMLTKIMDAERIPLNMLESKITTTETKISAWGTLKSKLSTLETSSTTLSFESSLQRRSATAADTSIVSANASYNAAVGSYGIEVTQLASAQKSFTNEYAAGTTFGQGDLNFTIAGQAKSISLTGQSSYTLEEVANQINENKIGVTATVITTASGSQRMVLSGDSTGTSNAFSLDSTMTASGGQSSLGSFDTSTVGLARADAQDALMKIDGIDVSSSTNSFSSSITGLTINATKTGSTTLTVATNKDSIVSSVQSFVDAFNAVVDDIKGNSTYDATTKVGGAFSGDSAARGILSSLNEARTTEPAGVADSSFKALSDLGISIQSNGKLSLDSAALQEALNENSGDVIKTLNAYGNAFGDVLADFQGSDGIVSNRVNGLTSASAKFADDKEAMELRLELIEKRYRAQFTALDTLVSSMSTTSSYLTQTFAALSSSSS
jgi:flagellar hook-associated protein 2